MKEGFVKNRFKEASTWRGIVGLLTLFGISLNPDQIELMAGIGAAVYMLIETFAPDKPAEELESLKSAKEAADDSVVASDGELQYDAGMPDVSSTGAGTAESTGDGKAT